MAEPNRAQPYGLRIADMGAASRPARVTLSSHKHLSLLRIFGSFGFALSVLATLL